ncbi:MULTISPECIES: hypothetical protein [Oceanobacillus]|uniref:Uncharacterized protein n=1 Tax=Oceanobacillus profundus TaxID=372463 RepID=A0A417Y9S1_9BACI|nr:hypothetical protein [Oceanobacillus profundus]MBR3121157.1 hypothetical protein [Oceanobacillus sp.]MCM3397804.1 hypothetical protein [Oceanobacillus profundus]PAE28029.1 hypothetical protein CHI07_16145 [Paenibacillus sp. 7884-2]RHW29276.1 hypothetical protein D1B32_22885 [Oceanobacillus profundus]
MTEKKLKIIAPILILTAGIILLLPVPLNNFIALAIASLLVSLVGLTYRKNPLSNLLIALGIILIIVFFFLLVV